MTKQDLQSAIVSYCAAIAIVLTSQFVVNPWIQVLLIGAFVGAAGGISFSLGRKDALLWVNKQIDELKNSP